MAREVNASTERYYGTGHHQIIMQQQSCSSAFNCGQEYSTLEAKINMLTDRVNELEKDRKRKLELMDRVSGLINLQRYIIIMLPIVGLAIVGIIAYFLCSKSTALYSILGLLGMSAIINSFFVPKQIKDLEKKIKMLEDESKK